jgi:hypothetical protein
LPLCGGSAFNVLGNIGRRDLGAPTMMLWLTCGAVVWQGRVKPTAETS